MLRAISGGELSPMGRPMGQTRDSMRGSGMPAWRSSRVRTARLAALPMTPTKGRGVGRWRIFVRTGRSVEWPWVMERAKVLSVRSSTADAGGSNRRVWRLGA